MKKLVLAMRRRPSIRNPSAVSLSAGRMAGKAQRRRRHDSARAQTLANQTPQRSVVAPRSRHACSAFHHRMPASSCPFVFHSRVCMLTMKRRSASQGGGKLDGGKYDQAMHAEYY
ncbi:hypothetical protein BV20DRAFT_975424 [Pilatotrama ljubarskyi]|nr:hypothetical protein BV20DRAFT_975424 [Pilatotrama ljubarskyi]